MFMFPNLIIKNMIIINVKAFSIVFRCIIRIQIHIFFCWDCFRPVIVTCIFIISRIFINVFIGVFSNVLIMCIIIIRDYFIFCFYIYFIFRIAVFGIFLVFIFIRILFIFSRSFNFFELSIILFIFPWLSFDIA